MKCWYCRQEVDKGQSVHPHCYEKAHPPEPAKTLGQALVQDPVLARRLLTDHVPLRVARKILEEFNQRVHADWVVRGTPPCNPCVVFE